MGPGGTCDDRDKVSAQFYAPRRVQWSQLQCYNKIIASLDGVPRLTIMWEPVAPCVTISQGLSNCDATTGDAQECAKLRCLVPPSTTDEQLSICHRMCHSATLRPAVRERGWASTDDIVVDSADGCVLTTYASSRRRPQLQVVARVEPAGPMDGMPSGQPHY